MLKKLLILMTLAALLAGCVNLHVHFPEANKPAEPVPAGAAK